MHRLAIDFAVDGDIRFCSHRDMLRLFARAAVRAGLPIRYSEGFNPHPKLRLPLPRPVGVGSDAERLVLELTEETAPDEAVERLAAQVPQGVRLLGGRTLQPGNKSRPIQVRYRVEIPTIDRCSLQQRAADLLESSTVPYKRTDAKSGKVKEMDLRQSIEAIAVGDDCIELVLSVLDECTARPSEVISLLGIEAERINHRIRRLEVQWQ